MQFSLPLAAMLFASTGLAQYTNKSANFGLYVTSADGTYDSKPLNACHSGALIESLCIYDSPGIFNLNTSTNTGGDQPVFPGHTPQGLLVYSIPSLEITESQAMQFYLPYSTSLGSAMFGIGSATPYVNFDQSNDMNIVERYNDTVAPPSVDTPEPLYKWYICQTNYAAYEYYTLNWLYGSEASNPSCKAVTVQREFFATH